MCKEKGKTTGKENKKKFCVPELICFIIHSVIILGIGVVIFFCSLKGLEKEYLSTLIVSAVVLIAIFVCNTVIVCKYMDTRKDMENSFNSAKALSGAFEKIVNNG